MSTNRHYRAYSEKQLVGTNGRRACLQCKGDITDKQRSTFCRKECADAFYIKSRPDHARLKVFERDKGICAKCGKNVFEETGRKPRARGTGDLWQADHIIPVVEGGGECTLDNLRSLCTACHKNETAGLARRRAQVRKPPEMLPQESFDFARRIAEKGLRFLPIPLRRRMEETTGSRAASLRESGGNE